MRPVWSMGRYLGKGRRVVGGWTFDAAPDTPKAVRALDGRTWPTIEELYIATCKADPVGEAERRRLDKAPSFEPGARYGVDR